MKTIEEKIAVMQAFAEGKTIEYSIISDKLEDWIITESPFWDWIRIDYRVKEEPKQPEYIPFTFEDAEFLIGKIVKSKNEKWIEMLICASENEISNSSYEFLLDCYTFLDGSPCGKLKQ